MFLRQQSVSVRVGDVLNQVSSISSRIQSVHKEKSGVAKVSTPSKVARCTQYTLHTCQCSKTLLLEYKKIKTGRIEERFPCRRTLMTSYMLENGQIPLRKIIFCQQLWFPLCSPASATHTVDGKHWLPLGGVHIKRLHIQMPDTSRWFSVPGHSRGTSEKCKGSQLQYLHVIRGMDVALVKMQEALLGSQFISLFSLHNCHFTWSCPGYLVEPSWSPRHLLHSNTVHNLSII